MTAIALELVVSKLVDNCIEKLPQDVARKLEVASPNKAAKILSRQPTEKLLKIWNFFVPSTARKILVELSPETIKTLLTELEPQSSVSMLRALDTNRQKELLALLEEETAKELTELLSFPGESVGAIMNPRMVTVHQNMTTEQTLKQIKNQSLKEARLYVLDDEHHLKGRIEIHQLLWSEPNVSLKDMMQPIKFWASPFDPQQEVSTLMEKQHLNELAVLDVNDKLIGVIDTQHLLGAVKEGLTSELQTMVGASRDERALSSAWFAVKKRLPWLHINLITAFLAAAVVGLFENTIAQVTALAVLMPVVAGQSGNAGAQALAVTMRGLTLREITMRHWLRVMFKEVQTGFLNGCAIAITTSLGVFVWSKSIGLALVIALSMVISMVAAGMAGALVPIVLKRFGQDPAQSSSIILTTVTDIAGFFSFLGIASLLMSKLT